MPLCDETAYLWWRRMEKWWDFAAAGLALVLRGAGFCLPPDSFPR